MDKLGILLLTALAMPNIAFACSGKLLSSLLAYYVGLISLVAFFSVLLVVIIKSIKNKNLYRGKLNIVLLIFFIVFILMLALGEYNQYKELKEIEDCTKNCKPDELCFCNPLCS